jgi:hypothetical protein
MVLDGLRIGITQIPLYSLVFQLRPTGGQLQAHPLECRAVGWFAESNLPSPLAGAGPWKEHAFKAIRNEAVEVLFDRPRQPVWRKPEPDADTATEGDAQPANDGQPSRDSQPAGGVQSSGSVQS